MVSSRKVLPKNDEITTDFTATVRDSGYNECLLDGVWIGDSTEESFRNIVFNNII